jgi:hypothetical protein
LRRWTYLSTEKKKVHLAGPSDEKAREAGLRRREKK